MRGNFEGFSYERLFHMLNSLGENVRIVVTDAKPRTRAALKLQLRDKLRNPVKTKGRLQGGLLDVCRV
jgi:hypothetical protein